MNFVKVELKSEIMNKSTTSPNKWICVRMFQNCAQDFAYPLDIARNCEQRGKKYKDRRYLSK